MDTAVPRNIVVSAVNIRKGGTLTVLRDCLAYLAGREDLHVTAIVHKRSLCDYPGIDYIELPWSIESWLKRLKCEYRVLPRISRTLPDTELWLSLHDTTPRVKARRQAVYCHAPFPFMKSRLRDWKMDYKIALFSLFTRYAYKWNVRRNRYLIVQQSWMRDALSHLLHFPANSIIVAPPSFKPLAIPNRDMQQPPVFLYPATADVHKDFETLCQAARLLENRVGKNRFRVLLTIKGDENRYAQWLNRNWGDVASLDFHGLLSRDALAEDYAEAACLVFPSRAETWGLPISEFLPTGKPMILADLPYAHCTASGAQKVAFFRVMDPGSLAERMEDILEGRNDIFSPVPTTEISAPYAPDWDSLFHMLLS